MRIKIILIFAFAMALVGCRKRDAKLDTGQREDFQAKKMLQGIWVNDGDDNDVAFMAKGDTIYYPDNTSQPVYFKVIGDTLYMKGAKVAQYPILKQAPHLFEFKNQVGDVVKLIKSSNSDDKYAFGGRQHLAINQRQLIKRDTIVTLADNRYHCYIQVNPTSYKVVKSTYNDDGVEVDNVYYDNIIHLSIYKDASSIFSRDFRKSDFKGKVPEEYLQVSILSDMLFSKIDAAGIHYTASLCVPDTQSSYVVDVCVSKDGRFTLAVLK